MLTKKTLRIIALLMSIILMLSGFAGCKRVEDTGSDIVEEIIEIVPGETVIEGTDSTTNQIADNNSGGNANPTTNNASSTNSKDLKGATVTIAAWGSSDVSPQPTDEDYAEKKKLIATIEKKYNCKIKFKSIEHWGAYTSALNAALASGTHFADIVSATTSWVFPTNLIKGYILPLDSYLNLNDPMFNKKMMNACTYKGKHYLMMKSNDYSGGMGLYINKKVFNICGVTDLPEKYVSSSNWTWDTFRALAQKLTKSVNGTQYYGFASSGLATTTRYLSASNGTYGFLTSKNNRQYFNGNDPKFIKTIQFVYDLYNKDKIMPDVKDAATLWENGRVAMMTGSASSYDVGVAAAAIGAENLAFTYLPLGPDTKEYTYSRSEATCYFMPKTVKNPEIIAQIMKEYYYPYKWADKSIEEVSEGLFNDETSGAVALDTLRHSNDYYSFGPLYSYITNTVMWGDYGITKQTSPQSYIASVQATAEQELNSTWKGYEK